MSKHKLSEEAKTALNQRYFLKDENNKPIENWDKLVQRVASNVASVEKKDKKQWEEKFYKLMLNADFLPNSPCLMNAGTVIQQLSACFVLEIFDTTESIMGTMTDAVHIHRSGGGTGFDWSRIRPTGSTVKSTQGVASGPVSFMTAYDKMTSVIRQGGKRRGANMGCIRCSHPDVMDFITCKTKDNDITNFNISITLTDEFMMAVQNDTEHELKFGEKTYSKLPARDIWRAHIRNSWQNGEPGFLFIDTINRNSGMDEEIVATNPCVAEGTLVAIPGGWEQVENIEVGDSICTVLGTGLVDSIEKHVDQPVLKVMFSDGGEQRVTAAHKYHIKVDGRWVPTRVDQIQVGDEVRTCYDMDACKTVILYIVSDGIATVYDLHEPESDTWITEGYVQQGCGEVPLPDYGSCNLGSINLKNHIKDKEIDWEKLKNTTEVATRFLDDVIDVSKFPLDKIDEKTKYYRPLGLGVMGFADLLFIIGIRYGASESREIAEKIMSFIESTAWDYSKKLAKERGKSPAAKEKTVTHVECRNSSVTCIAPTGTLSIIAGVVGGMEPIFDIVEYHSRLDNHFLHINPTVAEICIQNGIRPEDIQDISINDIKDNPEEINKRLHDTREKLRKRLPDYIVSASEIPPEEHVRMQAAFQEHTSLSISKTINFSNNATEAEMGEAVMLAWKLGCKGLTMYRDGSRSEQPISSKAVDETGHKALTVRERGKVTTGFSVSEKTGCGTAYVQIMRFLDTGKDAEVFCTMSKHGNCVASFHEAIGRIISASLRAGVKLEDIAKQLKGIRCSNPILLKRDGAKSCPDAISKALQFYIDKIKAPLDTIQDDTEKVDKFIMKNIKAKKTEAADISASVLSDENIITRVCPECDTPLIYREGCNVCLNCGYKACGG